MGLRGKKNDEMGGFWKTLEEAKTRGEIYPADCQFKAAPSIWEGTHASAVSWATCTHGMVVVVATYTPRLQPQSVSLTPPPESTSFGATRSRPS